MTVQGVQRERGQNKYTEDLNISCLAFADDTTFIVDSQCNMQEILDKANKFYCINDIDINPKKSELIVVNTKKENTQRSIRLGRQRSEVKALDKEKAAWFLGV